MPRTGSRKTASFFKFYFFPLAATVLPILFGFSPETAKCASFTEQCNQRVGFDLKHRGILSDAVLGAMQGVPLHEFVLARHLNIAYADRALPIKENQTISQPYIVALMTESAPLKSTDRVLEIGTESAYQSVEKLARNGYKNVKAKQGVDCRWVIARVSETDGFDQNEGCSA